jgi:hypothetical protein
MSAAPLIDPRGYQELLDEALARIPVHTPEWTNFNRSDPGVTLVELFAFLTEAHLYRANQIPERSRRKFLELLGVPIAPASSAVGLVAFANERGPLQTETVDAGLEVAAGQVPFRTDLGLDILPVEGRAFVKQPLPEPLPADLVEQYRTLYASLRGERPSLADVRLYRTTPLEAFGQAGAALQATADNSLWIALLLRESDASPQPEEVLRRAREQLAGRTLTLGVVPVLADPRARVGPAATAPAAQARLDYQLPQLPPGGLLPTTRAQRVARYRSLPAQAGGDVLAQPGIVQIPLPDDPDALALWANLDPLESGAADFPPGLEDTALEGRLVTWLRVKAPSGAQATLLWAGINAATVSQRAHVAGEVLPDGTGEPDQVVRLAYAPVVAGTVTVEVTLPSGDRETWHEIDDLLAAGAEVPVRDPRQAPGTPDPPARESRVFTVDAATGELRFGDGLRGRRPPALAQLYADYDYGAGAAGNVAREAIAVAPALPAGIRVSNPVPTWGGADAETVPEAEKQAARYLQHRDRLVTAEDFEAIVRRTPGVELGRVEVLPTYNPLVTPATPIPGGVTVLVIPRIDALHPAAPEPDRLFLDAICRYIDPRRLVTTEVFLRGPDYVDVWISVGIEVEAGRSVAVVREEVRRSLTRFLAPIDPEAPDWFEDEPATLASDLAAHPQRGWPLGKPVQRLELLAVASRVPGVRLVNGVQLAAGLEGPAESVPISGLQLPRVRAIAVGADAADLGLLRGQLVAPDAPAPTVVPVPVVPETC